MKNPYKRTPKTINSILSSFYIMIEWIWGGFQNCVKKNNGFSKFCRIFKFLSKLINFIENDSIFEHLYQEIPVKIISL